LPTRTEACFVSLLARAPSVHEESAQKQCLGQWQERIAQYQRLDFSDIAHIMGFEGTTPRAD